MTGQKPGGRFRVAYIMSRFPKLTETFVLNEILALRRMGIAVEIYPLLHQQDTVRQPGVDDVMANTHYTPYVSTPILASQLHFLRRRPRAYIGAFVAVMRENFGSTRLFLGALALFPKVAHMARMLSEREIPHVHCHFATHPALAGFVIRRLTGIPYSFTAHGSDIHLYRHMLCRKVAEAAFVIAVSESNARVIQARCGDSVLRNVFVLHCGVDTQIFRPPAMKEVGDAAERAPDQLHILCIGTLHEVKGQRHLIDACARLRDSGIPFHCKFVGDGPDRRMLQRYIDQLDLAQCVVLAGPRTQHEILDDLSDSDVLVAPSVPASDGRREGLPVVLMEAMSAGLPVVASRLSGIPELVEDGVSGILTMPSDSSAIADALSRLAGDPELRQRLGTQARRTVERGFDLTVNTGRLAALFQAAAIR